MSLLSDAHLYLRDACLPRDDLRAVSHNCLHSYCLLIGSCGSKQVRIHIQMGLQDVRLRLPWGPYRQQGLQVLGPSHLEPQEMDHE